MMKAVPKHAVDTLAALRAERVPLAAHLDAIDLSIDNLSRVYGLSSTSPRLLDSAARARQLAHGDWDSDQERPRRRRVARTARSGKKAAPPTRGADSPQRVQLLDLIGKSAHGLTLSELRAVTPKMDGADRSAHLQALKAAGQIQRVGNVWKQAA